MRSAFSSCMLGLVLLAGACSSSTSTKAVGQGCTPGRIQECVAKSGCRGAQVCGADAAFEECECFDAGSGATAGSGGSAGNPGDGAAATAGTSGAGAGGNSGGSADDASTVDSGSDAMSCPRDQCNAAATPLCQTLANCACAACPCQMTVCGKDPGCMAVVACAIQNGCTTSDPNCFVANGPCAGVTMQQNSASVNNALALGGCGSNNGCSLSCPAPIFD